MSVHNKALFDTAGISGLNRDAGIAIVYTRWNDFIVNELVNGCKETLHENHIRKITEFQVPGTVELPFACKRIFEAAHQKGEDVDAIIAFGCVIRGETPHFDYVCDAATQGITQLNITLPVPVIYGILTVENVEQAKDRIGGAHGHKGKEAAISALQMITFNRNCFK